MDSTQSSLVWSSPVQSSPVQSSPVWSRAVRSGLIQSSLGQSGLVRSNPVQPGPVWFYIVQSDSVQSGPGPVLLKTLQDGLVSRLFQEAQQVVGLQPHGGAVGHGVEIDPLVTPLHQVPVQNELDALLLIEEQSERRGTALTHLTPEQEVTHSIKKQKHTTLQQTAEPTRWARTERGDTSLILSSNRIRSVDLMSNSTSCWQGNVTAPWGRFYSFRNRNAQSHDHMTT